MQRVRIVFFVAFALFSTLSNGQKWEFHHGVGASMAYSQSTYSSAILPTTNYHPRVVMKLNRRRTSLSLGAPIGMFLNFSVNSQSGSSGGFVFEAPLAFDFNFGHGALERTRADAGGFIGLGYGYYYGGFSEIIITGFGDFITSGSNSILAPYAHVGIRFQAFETNMSASVFTYIPTSSDVQIFGVRLLYELTDFK